MATPSTKNTAMKKIAAIVLSALVFSGLVHASPASATGSDIEMFFSAPFVSGSYLNGSGVYTETFNGSASCPASPAVGTMTGSCSISALSGTATPDGDPHIGSVDAALSNFATTSDATFSYANPVSYVGFWWMMGSSNNYVDFIDDQDNVIASMNSADIMSFLGISYGTVTDSDTGTLTTVDNATHLRKRYFKSPSTWGGTLSAPTNSFSPAYANEPWVYLNLYVPTGISVKKTHFYGGGFEIDNLTVSTNTGLTPQGSMVLVKGITVTRPQAITWAPTNTTNAFGTPVTPSPLAAVTTPVSGGNAISYSVQDAGTTGCTVNSSTGAISASAIGDCVIRATAASGNGYAEATADSTFTFTAPPAPTPSGGSGSDAEHKPNAPIAGDVIVQTTPKAIRVWVNYSGKPQDEPTSYLVTLQPTGETCQIFVALELTCGFKKLSPDIEYSFTITATNKFGTSAAYVSPRTYFLTSTSWLSAAGQKTITKFGVKSAALTKAYKKAISAYLKANPLVTNFSCVGYIAGKSKTVAGTATLKARAQARAKSVCAYIVKVRPTATAKASPFSPVVAAGVKNRKVVIKAYN